MAVSFKLNNFDFPLLSILSYLSLFPLFLFRYYLLLHVVLPVMLVLFLKVCPSKLVCASNVYSSKPVSPSNDCQSKPVVL